MSRIDEWTQPDSQPALGAGEVHVWSASLDVPPAELARLAETLAPDERARADRFRFPLLRARFIAGRGILRALLAAHVGIAPHALRLEADAHGKPRLIGSTLHFNLAHCEDRVLYTIADGRRVGVDLEHVRPDLADLDVARRLFAAPETAALDALGSDARASAFFRVWTVKEAYLKARGEGLSVGLDTFAVPLGAATVVDPDGVPWSLVPLEAGAGWTAAVVAEGTDLRLAGWLWPARHAARDIVR